MSNSFALIRSNPGLSTNIKIMVDSNYGMHLESIDTVPELTSSKYKKVTFNKDNYYDELIPHFYKKTPSEISYAIKYENDIDNMFNDFAKQYDDIYQMGARNITDNKNYTEEFECFAPLYITKNNIPKYFSVFRVDGPGLINLTKDNFKLEIVNKLKSVKLFDLTKSTTIGQWIDKNFSTNPSFPPTPFEMDFRRLEFSKWNGIDYLNGGYTYKSLFLDQTLETENTIFDLEKFIFDGYKNTGIVFPNIINFSFLFDDTPATSKELRKWSINRYFGFYLDDMELYDSVTPNLLPRLKNGVIISEGNILESLDGESPFLEGWKESLIYYVEYDGSFYKVEKFTEDSDVSLIPTQISNSSNVIEDSFSTTKITKYRIISDLDLESKESNLNQKIITIDDENNLLNFDLTNYVINDFNTADIWMIEIDGKFHNLIKDGDSVLLNTDYAFKFVENGYEYWINENDTSYKKSISLIVTQDNDPKSFKIYKIKMTDIKDFDTSIIDTEYSKFEYEKKDEITITDESKMYTVDLRSKSNPKELNDYIYKDEVVNIPASSEYTSNLETFRIFNRNLSEIWRKNPIYSRWAYQGSISTSDCPYLLNNSLIFEDFNRGVNTYDPDPKRIERNLDHFYSINSSTSSYVSHTLHIENNINGYLDTSFKFELDKYLNLGTYSIGTSSATYSFDYFSYFFDRKTTFDNGNIVKNVNKFSLINTGDEIIPNSTLFRGIKFNIYDVENIKSSGNRIENINLKNSNQFENYKFSILMSDNEFSVSSDGGITSSTNQMDWTIIEDWEMDKTYSTGSIVSSNDSLYESISNVTTTDPSISDVKSGPYNDSTNWSVYNYPPGVTYSPFWNPSYTYSLNEIVYNNGEYYINVGGGSSTYSFWNPLNTYTQSDIVLYKNYYYVSQTSSNTQPPDNGIMWRNDDTWYKYWEISSSPTSPEWQVIEIWNPSIDYPISQYIINNNIVYKSINDPSTGDEPGVTNNWIRIYGIDPDTDFIYGTISNPFIKMNNKYYLINSNIGNSTLENGINVYINKKWKNILINITINDNTTPNMSNVDRDILYSDLNKKITANNLINCINDVSEKYGFSDYLNYIIIDENGLVSKYNIENITSLPYMIICETADELSVKINSLTYNPISIGKNIIKANNTLNNGNIKDISQLNYYNEIPIGFEIFENDEVPKILPIYHGTINITEEILYRYSGYYTPLFYNIEMFEKSGLTSSTGNYKFDTSLTNFGIIKQRIISKINRNENILKLRNNMSYKSIYPMLDEFGYTTSDFFMFKSTWDFEYHIECNK